MTNFDENLIVFGFFTCVELVLLTIKRHVHVLLRDQIPVDPQQVAIGRMFLIAKTKILRQNCILRTKFYLFYNKICEICKIAKNRILGFTISKFEKIEIRVNDPKLQNLVGFTISKRDFFAKSNRK